MRKLCDKDGGESKIKNEVDEKKVKNNALQRLEKCADGNSMYNAR